MRKSGSKIRSLEELETLLTEEKARGRVVVMANGCFDVLHVGHVRYLEAARDHGDLLVVAINSDESVRRLKGPGRPLIPQRERLELVAALEAVDYVFLFDDPTLDRILLKLKPHIQAKGTDYTEESVPERETVLSYGGRVVICGDPKDHSSSELMKRLVPR